MIEILNRWTAAVMYRADVSDVREAVLQAAQESADLSGANLSGANLRRADLSDADLSGADLRRADLSGANLSDADLTDADLTDADLSGANLSGANLRRANLRRADLSDADLSGADLSDANLSGANLSDADLTDADLSGADLTPIRDDIWAVLSASPKEVPALRAAVIEGRIEGSTYVGECCCLVGTLANERHCEYGSIPGLAPNSARPSERFFALIHSGDTPETNQASKLVLEWVDQWLANVRTLIAS